MTRPVVAFPRDEIIVTKAGITKLTWGKTTRRHWQGKYGAAQKYVDSEVLRLSEPFIPLRTGTLIKTGTLGTDIGSGLVMWIAPYSRIQYYSRRKPGSITGPLRGPFWFERMKSVHLREIIAGVRAITGR